MSQTNLFTSRVNNDVVDMCLADVKAGDIEAHVRLGNLYQVGHFVQKNDVIAFGWYMKAAELGSVEGNYLAGLCLCNGRGTRKNTRKAAKYLRVAADQRHVKASQVLALHLLDSCKKNIKSCSSSLSVSKSGLEQSDVLSRQLIESKSCQEFKDAFEYLKIADSKGGQLASYYFATGEKADWEKVIRGIGG